MADYYTIPEADARFAEKEHTHDLSTLGGSELDPSRVMMPESVAADFDDAFTIDEGFVSIKNQLAGKAASNHSHSGYAPASHTHSGYAESDHTHTPAAIGAAPAEHTHDYAGSNHTHTPAAIGAAPVAHTHDYAGTDHTHTPASIGAAPSEHTHTPASLGAAPSSHSHAQSEVTGLGAALEGKANTGHTHAQTDITGLPAALGAKADLVDGKVPASQLPSFVDDVVDGTLVNETTFKNTAGTTVTPESDKIYNDTDANKSYRWSGSQYVALNEGVALGETSATAYRGDRGKIAYEHSQNGDVHVTAALKTTWDSKAAGNHTHTPAAIGAAPASHGHSYNDLSDKPTIPAAYTHPASHPASMITGLASVATTGNYNDLENKPTIPTTLPANGGDADTVDGKHASDFIAKALQFTSDLGGMEKTFYVEDNTNLITELEALSMGFHTVYSQGGVPGNPNTAESWRCFLHKPSSNIMWVLAFGTSGSIYSNYWNGGNWRGWRKFYSTGDAPTATEVGAATADHGHMVYNSATSVTTYKLVYVGTNGNDNNTGFSTGVPMKTIKGVIRKYAEKYKMLDIRLLDGTYTEDIGSIATDVANLSIRSVSENKDAVKINMATQLDLNSNLVRLYNMTLNVTATGVRGISANAGALYMYNVRINLPTASGSSCVNIYNGTQAFLMNCVLNAGTGTSAGAAIYGNQAMMIKAINCTSERKNNVGVHAHNGSDIWYTDTINATTKAKETSWGKCTVRS